MNFEASPMTRKLGEISEVMADGFYFVQMRAFIEAWEKDAATGSPDAVKMMEVINTFHRLCSVVKNA
jgi:hypothetical protein